MGASALVSKQYLYFVFVIKQKRREKKKKNENKIEMRQITFLAFKQIQEIAE